MDAFDFDLVLPSDIADASGRFLEEQLGPAGSGNLYYHESANTGLTAPFATAASLGGPPPPTHHAPGAMMPVPPTASSSSSVASGQAKVTRAGTRAPGRKASRAESEAVADDGWSDDGDGNSNGEDKKTKRRRQIAAASRQSRARRKRELEDLRDENEKLREERSQFLSKIGELQLKVEALREQGSTDMRVENELLRAQLDEHKRFVACFKRLSDGAPSSLNARHAIYRQGADNAHAHVLGLVSQSQADDWRQASVPLEADLPYQNLSVFYKMVEEFGSAGGGASADGPQRQPRRRLNLRVDALFPGIDAESLGDFFFESFSSTATQQRLYKTRGVEITPLADDMPDKDTKMLYYRERGEGPDAKDQDLVLICNKRRKELAKSTLALPQVSSSGGGSSGQRAKPAVGKVAAMVLAMSTTQHSAAPEYDNAHRINSLFVQGAVVWNLLADARLCVVFSFPDDISLKAVQGIDEILVDGTLTMKFVEILRSYRQELGNRI